MKNLKIVIAQINPTVGAVKENAALIQNSAQRHPDADLVVFPELSLTGYSPEDLLNKASFLETVRQHLDALARATATLPALLVGAPYKENDQLFNCAFLLSGGKIHTVIKKCALPNYGVFDEMRWFASGPTPIPVEFKNTKLGILVCEDFWRPDSLNNFMNNRAEGIIVINASPFDARKHPVRLTLARSAVKKTGLPVAYCHMYGGQDDVVFDGGSFVVDETGELRHQAAFNREDAILINWNSPSLTDPVIDDKVIYDAIVLATRDYIRKNGFKRALLGLSGGIDSAFVACIAADALGADNIDAYMLASRFTSNISKEDAKIIAHNLKINLKTVDLQPDIDQLSNSVKAILSSAASSVVFENLQSRLRGLYLMALSNESGGLLLTTGNKSEMAMGYATLYGDMNGGFNPVKDLYKTDLYRIAQSCCGNRIPERVFTRPPSAELKENQTDQDSLPPYALLDDILHGLIEQDLSIDELIAEGLDAETVRKTARLLNRAEYKRRQSAPGPKITTKAFGRERRMPITNQSE